MREGLLSGAFDADHVVVAEHQTRGRGRRGDKWEAPAGKNLLFSVAHQLPADQTRWPLLPLLAGECVARTCRSLLDADDEVAIKWPNDIYINGKKAAGILVETALLPVPQAIIGIGINVNLTLCDLPEELRLQATSLRNELGCQSSIAYVLGLTLYHLLRINLTAMEQVATSLEWIRAHDWLRQKMISVTLPCGAIRRGLANGYGENGELLLQDSESCTHHIVSAEKVILLD